MICRFGVVKLGSPDAESLLGWMTARLKHALMKHNVIRTTSLFVDDIDKQQVGQAYTRRIASSFPLLSPSLCLFNWAVLSLNIGQPYLVITFFKVAYLRLWAALDPMKETWPLGLVQIMNLLEYIDHLMGYTRALIQGEGPEEPSNTLKVSLGGLAWQNDIISLLARALVAHLQDHQNEHIIEFLLRMLLNVENSMAVIFAHCPPSPEISNNAYTDWLKGAKLFRELLWAPNRTKPSRVYLTKCHKKWMKLGSLIFGDRMTDRQETCSNPRCPYPCPVSSGDDHLVCGRCFLGVYCSYACQHAHSLYRRPDDPPLHTCIPPDILPVLANESSIVVPYSYKP
ncbi:hypothetical protein BDV93DRAFT_339205 [Ceratobasidium sp. AG-I]|nr:hypothetical protein BDV93DRAFT_339205 [Ceratobasidium sp. AG-I]